MIADLWVAKTETDWVIYWTLKITNRLQASVICQSGHSFEGFTKCLWISPKRFKGQRNKLNSDGYISVRTVHTSRLQRLTGRSTLLRRTCDKARLKGEVTVASKAVRWPEICTGKNLSPGLELLGSKFFCSQMGDNWAPT